MLGNALRHLLMGFLTCNRRRGRKSDRSFGERKVFEVPNLIKVGVKYLPQLRHVKAVHLFRGRLLSMCPLTLCTGGV